jgi:methylmalonyl-CoA/ethylmalonyl-CoA epimerase
VTDPSENNPLGIKRIDHVAMAAPDLRARVRFFEELFGMKSGAIYDNAGDGFNGVELVIPGSDSKIEILEPNGERSFLNRFLEEGGSMLHHLTFQVHDVVKAAEALRQRGIEPFRMRLENAWNKELFIHPRDTGGVLIQLYEETPSPPGD